MDFSQQELDHGNAVLNDYAVNVTGSELSFYVHYWGGETRLPTNHVHKHSFFEICYVADGEGRYEEGGESWDLRPGTLFLSRPHLKHQIISERELYLVFVAFELIPSASSEEGVQRFQSLEKSQSFVLPDAAELPSVWMWLALLKMTSSARRFFDDGILGLACSLLTSFESAFGDRLETAKAAPLQPSASTLVHRAKLYIRDNLAQELKLSSVADYLHVSSRHLSRLFGEELGQSYSTYVRKERIRYAVQLLTTTEWSIKRVAEECGFDTVHYFTTVFKSEMGEPPGQFLKKLRSAETF